MKNVSMCPGCALNNAWREAKGWPLLSTEQRQSILDHWSKFNKAPGYGGSAHKEPTSKE